MTKEIDTDPEREQGPQPSDPGAPPLCIGCDCPVGPEELAATAASLESWMTQPADRAYVAHLCDECRVRAVRRRSALSVTADGWTHDELLAAVIS